MKYKICNGLNATETKIKKEKKKTKD